MAEDQQESADLLGFTEQDIAREKGRIQEAEVQTDRPVRGSSGRYHAHNNRYQVRCVGMCLDDQVARESLVRMIDGYVEELDLAELGFAHAGRNASVGQPPYHPGCLLKLYLYGYLNQVRSSRRLAHECQINLEVMWLIHEQQPGYRTIADFRSRNAQAITNTHEHFILLCEQMGLIGGQRISIDGSHFKGNVSAKSFITKKSLQRKRAAIKEQVRQWQKMLDSNDAQPHASLSQQEPLTEQQIAEELAQLEQQLSDTEQGLEQLSASGRNQQSRTDPDAHLLRKRSKTTQGYNVQIATDHKYHMIVGDLVPTDRQDVHQLLPVAQLVKQRFGLTKLEVVADKGYYSTAGLKQCNQHQITPYIAIPNTPSPKQAEQRYKRSEFVYDAELDAYRCPADQLLKRSGEPRNYLQRYRSKAACRRCDKKSLCVADKSEHRDIYRNTEIGLVEAHKQRMENHPEIYAERSAAVEHPFGTLKARAGWSHFLVRTHEKVAGEWRLMVLCYNFTRAVNILGFDKLLKELKRLSGQERGNFTLTVIKLYEVSRIALSALKNSSCVMAANTIALSKALKEQHNRFYAAVAP